MEQFVHILSCWTTLLPSAAWVPTNIPRLFSQMFWCALIPLVFHVWRLIKHVHDKRRAGGSANHETRKEAQGASKDCRKTQHPLSRVAHPCLACWLEWLAHGGSGVQSLTPETCDTSSPSVIQFLKCFGRWIKSSCGCVEKQNLPTHIRPSPLYHLAHCYMIQTQSTLGKKRCPCTPRNTGVVFQLQLTH